MADKPNGRDPTRDAPDHEEVLGALHDVSNALTVMLGWIGEARTSETAAQREHALTMAEQRARIARDLARRELSARRALGGRAATEAVGAIDARNTEPDGPFDAPFDVVVREVVEALELEAAHAGVRITIAPPLPSSRVRNAASIAQILTNLLLNAIAFGPKGTAVTIEAALLDNALYVDVQDRGPGVEAARASAIFEGDSTREGGTGVGLRYARTLARTAGGELALIASQPLDHGGARFRLSWPRTGASIPPPPDVPSKPQLLAGTRVLIVEDDADVASLLETALGARGAHVTVAASAEALARAAEQPHDAALLDLSPIAADLEGAIARVRAVSPDVRLVFISGSAVGMPEALASEPSPPRWVRKPFEIREVVDALADAMPEARRRMRS